MLKIAFDPTYILKLPPNHRFPMSKYELIPQQLMYEGIVEKINFFSPNKIKKKRLGAAHDVEYIQKLENLSLSKSERLSKSDNSKFASNIKIGLFSISSN